MRKPNLRATETGSSIALFQFEPDGVAPERDLVVGAEDLRAVHWSPVDARAVGGAEVGEHPRAASRSDLGVLTRHVAVAEDDVALAAAADRDPGRTDDNPPILDHEEGALGASRCALLKRFSHPAGRAVDHRPARRLGGRLGIRLARRLDDARLDTELPE